MTSDGRPIRVALPVHLRTLAGAEAEVTVSVPRQGEGPPTTRRLLDVLEAKHPPLRGTIRHHETGERRAYMRYFVGKDDVSHDDPDAPLPPAVLAGEEPFRILGAIAGG